MFKYKRILSSFLIIVYVLSGAHGTVFQCQSGDHKHAEHHSHEHHSHDDVCKSDSQLITVSHNIYHSVIHFIDHLSHDHESCLESSHVVKQTKKIVNSYPALTAIIPLNLKELSFSVKAQLNEVKCHFTDAYLQYTSLRGPPTVV